MMTSKAQLFSLALHIAVLSPIFCPAQPTATTKRADSQTTIGPYSPPKKTGVPDWVYQTQVPPSLRPRFEFLYELRRQALQGVPTSNVENIYKLFQLFADMGDASAGALGLNTPMGGLPIAVTQRDNRAQLRWAEEKIRESVAKYHLENVALSDDLVPFLRAAPPTTKPPVGGQRYSVDVSDSTPNLRSAPDGRELSVEERVKLLTPMAPTAGESQARGQLQAERKKLWIRAAEIVEEMRAIQMGPWRACSRACNSDTRCEIACNDKYVAIIGAKQKNWQSLTDQYLKIDQQLRTLR